LQKFSYQFIDDSLIEKEKFLAYFSYKGVDGTGETITGLVEAVDKRAAIAELADKGHFATELLEKSGSAAGQVGEGIFSLNKITGLGSAKISSKDILAMTTQLSTALRAGLPILNALELIADQQHRVAMRELVGELANAVRSGQALSDAMEEYPKVFSRLYVSMVRVGETGGILEQTMTQLADLLNRDEKTKTNMKNASAYPIFVMILGILSVVIMLTKILPKIIETIGAGVAVLPLPTRMLLGISDFLTKYGWLAAIIIGTGLFSFAKWKRTEDGRLKWDTFKLKVPVLGSVLNTIAVGRFARTLGALTRSGIPILHALGVVRDTLGNELLGSEIDEVAGKVRMGESLAEPMSRSGIFPPLLVQIVAIGEQTGKLDELLLNAADTFDEDSEAAIKRFMALFPAVMIVLLAVIIGFIIIAMLLPIVAMDLGGIGF